MQSFVKLKREQIFKESSPNAALANPTGLQVGKVVERTGNPRLADPQLSQKTLEKVDRIEGKLHKIRVLARARSAGPITKPRTA